MASARSETPFAQWLRQTHSLDVETLDLETYGRLADEFKAEQSWLADWGVPGADHGLRLFALMHTGKPIEDLDPMDNLRLRRAYNARLLGQPASADETQIPLRLTGGRQTLWKVSALQLMLYTPDNRRVDGAGMPTLNGHMCVVQKGREHIIVNKCYNMKNLRLRVDDMKKAVRMQKQLFKQMGDSNAELKAQITAMQPKQFMLDYSRIIPELKIYGSDTQRLPMEWIDGLSLHMQRIKRILRTVFGYYPVPREELAQVATILQELAPPEHCVPTAILHTMAYPNTEIRFCELWYNDKLREEPPEREYPVNDGDQVGWVTMQDPGMRSSVMLPEFTRFFSSS